jgi:hypothetical protein
MAIGTDEWVENRIADARERKRMRCPYCNHVQGSETVADYITYWGYPDKGEEECLCEHCDRYFVVIEWVTREFETKKKEEGEECQEKEV